MTILNSILAADSVIVVSDSLMTDTENRPAAFVEKVYPVPSLGALISGRGVQQVIYAFATAAICRGLAISFDDLVLAAQQFLSAEWDRNDYEAGGMTSSVFLWGWSDTGQCFVGYAFRSGAGFAPEPLGYGTLIAPAPKVAVSFKDGVQYLLEVANQQFEDSLADISDPERCTVGGEVIVHQLQWSGSVVTVSSTRIYRFPNYEADLAAIQTFRNEQNS